MSTTRPILCVLGLRSEAFRRNGADHYDGEYGTLAQLIFTRFKLTGGLSLNQSQSSATN
jgi:hypothetical protein